MALFGLDDQARRCAPDTAHLMPTDLFQIVWVRVALGGILGLIFGSFITMLGYRLPRRLSIVRPRSSCPACHHALGVKDLFPVFSWLMSGGRCRHCKAPISARYPILEVLTSLAFMGCFFVSSTPSCITIACLCSMLALTILSILLSR